MDETTDVEKALWGGHATGGSSTYILPGSGPPGIRLDRILDQLKDRATQPSRQGRSGSCVRDQQDGCLPFSWKHPVRDISPTSAEMDRKAAEAGFILAERSWIIHTPIQWPDHYRHLKAMHERWQFGRDWCRLMDNHDSLLENKASDDVLLSALCEQVAQQADAGFCHAARQQGAQVVKPPVQPGIRSVEDATFLCGKKSFQFAARSIMNDKPGFHASLSKQTEIVVRQNGFPAKTHGGAVSNNADAQVVRQCGTRRNSQAPAVSA